MKSSRTTSLFGRFLTLTSVCGAIALTGPPARALAGCVASPAGMVSWWRAEGNANDSLGTNHGTLIGGLTFTNGEAGQAFNFDGVDDQILVANDPSLNFVPNQDFSVEAWIEPQVSTTTFDVMTIIDKRNAPDTLRGLGYSFALVGGRLECRISDSIANGGTSFGAAGPDLRDGQFHHVAVTITRNSTTGGHYYVDGAPVLTFDPTVEPGDLSNDQPLRIGKHATPSVFAQFKGRMDEVSIYQRALSAAEVQAIYNAGSAGKCVPILPPTCTSPPPGLVSWWRAEGNAQDAADGNNGDLVNGIGFAAGNVGQAFNLDGVRGHVRVADQPNLRLTNALTVEAWINPSVIGSPRSIVSKWDGVIGPDQRSYVLGLQADGSANMLLSPDGMASGYALVFGSNAVPLNQWTHVAGTYDGAALRIYVNGALQGETPYTQGIFPGTTDLGIGANIGGTVAGDVSSPFIGLFTGMIDEASIYNRALTAPEIHALFTASSGGKCAGTSSPPCVVAPSGLVSWWAAEGDAGDRIGNLNGYLYGGTSFAPGEVGQAFSFDGINDSITNSMSGLTNILDSYTMELWAWPTAGRATTPENTSGTDGHGNQRYAVFPHVGPSGGTVGAGISVGTNGVSVFEAGDTYLPALLVFDAPVTGWTHIAVVYTNRRPSLYLNGVLVRSGLTSVNHSCPSTWLGERGPASANQGYYAGMLDEFSIYNRPLSAAEIQAIYNAGSAGKCSAPVAPFIAAQPTNQTVAAGGKATFTVVAGGTQPLSYQWRHDGTNLSGAVDSTLTLTNVQFSDAGNYSVVVTNSHDSATSSNAVLTVNAAPPCAPPTSGLVSWWRGAGNAFDEIGGNDGTLAGDATYGVGWVGQGFVFDGIGDVVQLGNPTNLQTQNFTIEAWIQRASTSRVSLNGNGDGVIFGHDIGGYGLYLDPDGRPALTKVGFNSVTLSTRIADTNFHHLAVTKTITTIRFYIDGVAYSVAPYNPGFVFTKGASIGGIGTNSTFLGSIDDLAFYNRALTTNEVRAIYNAGSAGKCATLTPPVIMAQPASRSVFLEETVAFAVTVTGTPPLAYQWRFNGTNLDGATGKSLLLTNVQFADSGAYSVVVTNAAGTTNSSSATLTVNPPPPCTPAPAGLVSWWRAEGNGDDTLGTNAGTLIGGLIFTNGEVHQALSFDGVDDYVLVSNAPSLNFGAGQDFSVVRILTVPPE